MARSITQSPQADRPAPEEEREPPAERRLLQIPVELAGKRLDRALAQLLPAKFWVWKKSQQLKGKHCPPMTPGFFKD